MGLGGAAAAATSGAGDQGRTSAVPPLELERCSRATVRLTVPGGVVPGTGLRGAPPPPCGVVCGVGMDLGSVVGAAVAAPALAVYRHSRHASSFQW